MSPAVERHLSAAPRMLLDEQGREYRVLRCKLPPDDGGRRLTLYVELVSDSTRARATAMGLTPREAHIAELLARRATNREIASELGISTHTARHHTERVLAKLGVRTRATVREKLLR